MRDREGSGLCKLRRLCPALGRVCSVTLRALKCVQAMATLCLQVAVHGTRFPDGVLLCSATVVLVCGIATSGALLCNCVVPSPIFLVGCGAIVRALKCAQVKAGLCRRVAVLAPAFPMAFCYVGHGQDSGIGGLLHR